jgi:hypothetical protein
MPAKRRKPRGMIGSTTYYGDGKAVFSQVDLPAKKDDIERVVLAAALDAEPPLDLRTFYALTTEPEQLREQDFDFQLTTRSGTKYLDLMEVAPLETVGGSYQKVPAYHSLAERVEAVYAKILTKSAKYGRPRTSVHLLLYATDYRFDLEGGDGDLLAHRLNRREHCFATVLYARLYPGRRAVNRVLFPLSKVELRRLESEKMLEAITEVIFEPRQPLHRLTKEEEEQMRQRRAKKWNPPR